MKNVSLRIRKATEADADALGVIRVMCWQDAFQEIIPQEYLASMDMARDAEAIRRNMFIGGPEVFVGYNESVPAGYVIAEPCGDGDADESTGEISSIYVRSEYIGRGYAIRLMNTAVDALLKKGYRRIVTWTFRENARAISFFNQYGFQPDGAAQSILIGGAIIPVFRMVL